MTVTLLAQPCDLTASGFYFESYVDSLRELAEQFVEQGYYGDIPEPLQFYIDFDAIARDLACDDTRPPLQGNA